MENLTTFVTVVVFVVATVSYFLPTIVAGIRNKKNRAAICVLNILAGWTIIGWVGAIVWACVED